jgi:hypothetical protein
MRVYLPVSGCAAWGETTTGLGLKALHGTAINQFQQF